MHLAMNAQHELVKVDLLLGGVPFWEFLGRDGIIKHIHKHSFATANASMQVASLGELIVGF